MTNRLGGLELTGELRMQACRYNVTLDFLRDANNLEAVKVVLQTCSTQVTPSSNNQSKSHQTTKSYNLHHYI